MVRFVRPYLMSTTGITLVGTSSIAFSFLSRASDSSFIPLAVLIRLIEGVGSVAVKTASYAIIGTQFPEQVATIFASLETCFGIGLIVGPTLGGLLYQIGGFATPFAVIGSLLLVDACVMFIVLPRNGSRSGRSSELVRFWCHPFMVSNSLAVLSYFLFLGFFQVSLEPHLRQFNLSPFTIGCIFMLPGGVYAGCSPLWGKICDKGVNPRILVFIGAGVAILSEAVIGPVGFIPVDTELWMVLLGLSLMGLSGSLKLVSTFSICLRETLSRGFPNDLMTYALVSTMFATSQSIGAFIGPTSSGYLLDHFGFRWTLLLVMAVDLLLLVSLTIHSSLLAPNSNVLTTSVLESSCTKSVS